MAPTTKDNIDSRGNSNTSTKRKANTKEENLKYKTCFITQFFTVSKNVDMVADTSAPVDIAETVEHSTQNPFLDEQGSDKVEIYTDGSCFENGRRNARSALAFSIYINDSKYIIKSRVIEEPKKTNQRAELYAILDALMFVKQEIPALASNPNNFLTIYSDSEYSIKCVTEWCKNWDADDWEKKKNTDILKTLMVLYNEFNITFKHVRAHTSAVDKHSLRNNEVDQLARETLNVKNN